MIVAGVCVIFVSSSVRRWSAVFWEDIAFVYRVFWRRDRVAMVVDTNCGGIWLWNGDEYVPVASIRILVDRVRLYMRSGDT